MTLSFPSPEFDDAVAAVCHGSATDAEMRALNELLRDDAGARDEYLLRVELHTRLASEPDLFANLADVAAPRQSAAIFGGENLWRSIETPLQGQSPAWRKPVTWVVTLAACLVLAAVGVWSFWFNRPTTKSGATGKAVAMLTRTVDANWARGTGALRVGSALEPGWLRLESGLAQVVFYSGARLVIEGPAELELVSPGEAVCPTGRLLAEVPQPARGFRLRTAQVNVLDLGTAFGIDATRSRTEVHVFKGKVELLSGTTSKQSLAEKQAAVVEGNTPPRLGAANASAFASLFEFQQRSLASEAFRYERWQFANARLNQDPSLVVHLDFQDLSGMDWTLRNAAERNLSVPEATIVGCQRGEGRWREKHALEFQSVSDRVRLTVPGEFESLTLLAWVRVSGLDREFNSLFMCDGFEPGTIHWLIRNDGVLGLTVFGPGTGNYQILPSPTVITHHTFGTWLHLAVVLSGKAGEVVHYVNGSPVSRHAVRFGPPFRLGSAELGNWNVTSGPNPPPSLIRNLSGSLDEFELFSRALNDAEVHDLYVKGKPDA
jgi:hypothetical protein